MIGVCCQRAARRYLSLKALALSASLMDSWREKEQNRDQEGNNWLKGMEQVKES